MNFENRQEMDALGAARYIERTGALALALGVAVAMSPVAPIATEKPAPDQMSASGGWTGVVSAILMAFRSMFQRCGAGSSAD